jgi:hypothetical protein
VNSRNIRDRIVELVRVPANELVSNPKNWRTHPEQQEKAIEAVLGEIGFAGAELCRRLPDGRLMLIDGHARKKAMGNNMIPCLVTDLSESESDILLAVFDPLSAMASTDTSGLDDLLSSLPSVSEDLAELLLSVGKNAGCEWAQDQEQVDTSPQLPQGLQFRIVVECEDEFHQSRLLDKFNAEGLMCKGAVI